MLTVGIIFCLVIGVVLGFMVVQARFAARKWRQVIAEGDQDAIEEIVDQAFEVWRNQRPPRGTPPSDWRALQSAALVGVDRDRCRVSLLAEPDVRVVDGRRQVVAPSSEVARRVAVRMAERLLYEVPHAKFEAVQVDVLEEFRERGGDSGTEPLLTTRVSRETASYSDWEHGDAGSILEEWDTREVGAGATVEPERDAVITRAEMEAARAAWRASHAERSVERDRRDRREGRESRRDQSNGHAT